MRIAVAALVLLVEAASVAGGGTHLDPAPQGERNDRATLSGNWKLLVETPSPAEYPICAFSEENGVLTGTCGVPGTTSRVVDGMVRGDTVQWTLPIGSNAWTFTATRRSGSATFGGSVTVPSQSGTRNMAFTAEPTTETLEVKLALIDRRGNRTVLGVVPGDAFAPRVSPDGRAIAFSRRGELWIADVASVATPRRLPAMPNANFVSWDAAAERVFYMAESNGRQALFATRADAGEIDREPIGEPAHAPDSYSSVRNGLAFMTLDANDYDIWFLAEGDRRTIPLAVIKGSRQTGGQISPDGRWVAYESDETGEFEVWVQPFPSGPRTRVTESGGNNPRWSADGRELFFDRSRQLFSITVDGTTSLSFGAEQALPISSFLQTGIERRQWDLMPDGRFLVLVR